MPKSQRRRTKKHKPSDPQPPEDPFRIASATPPPGISIERYEFHDLRRLGTDDQPIPAVHTLEVWTSRRDQVIDAWLTAERILRAACTILLSPTEDVRPRVWTLLQRQSGEPLIDLSADLLAATGRSVPDDFRDVLKRLSRMRNLIAHQASRPRQIGLSEGLVFLKLTGFNQGSYVEVSYAQMDEATQGIAHVMQWLLSELPKSDMVSVELSDEAFDRLDQGE